MSVFARTGFSAKNYAAFRPTYPQSLYTKILSLTQSPSPATFPTILLDLGCGHGIAAAALAPHFSKTIALDPSAGMIAQAKSQHQDSKNTSFRVGAAEDLSFLEEGSMDLVVAAQAAHWFDYSRVWPELARVVKSKGSIAFWGCPDNIILGYPQANEIIDRFVYGVGEVAPGVEGLGPYWEQPGRNILRDLLRDIKPPTSEWEEVVRWEHEPGSDGSGGDGWLLRKEMTLGELEGYHRTFSSYNAWKDAGSGKERKDVLDAMWEAVIEAVPEWKDRGEAWRDVVVESDWGTALLVARRS